MKEDILEQLVDDYLKFNGYFTAHNVKFRPSADHPEYRQQHDCVASDMDVIGFHPRRPGTDRVWVVSCKSWQAGFDPRQRIEAIEKDKKLSGRKAWKSFRELVHEKWSDALILEVERLTGSSEFTYVTAVTKLKGDASIWEQYEPFRRKLRGNPIRILTLQEMLANLYGKIETSVAPSQVGRLLQVIKACGWKP